MADPVVNPGPTDTQREMLFLWTLLTTRPDIVSALPSNIQAMSDLPPSELTSYSWPNLGTQAFVLPLLQDIANRKQAYFGAFTSVSHAFAAEATVWPGVTGHPNGHECLAIFLPNAAQPAAAEPAENRPAAEE